MIDNPRVDLAVAKYGRSLVIAAVVIGVLSLLATGWVVANPSTTTTLQEVGEETVETEVQTSAIVVRDGLWAEGTELRDSSVYTLNDTPEVTLEPRTSVPTDDTAVSHTVSIRYEAVRDGETFWQETDDVLNTTAPTEAGTASSAVTVDVREVAQRVSELERELAGIGSVALTLEVSAEYDTGTNAGEQHVSSGVELSEVAYSFEGSMAESETHTQHTEVEVTESPNASLVGALALLATAAFGVATFVSRRTPGDATAARRAVHERRYAEWISHGRIPMWIGDHHIALDTLEDVVDVAIDTSERVVHDRQRGLFAVVSDDVIYYYSDRGVWEETAWPDISLEQRETIPDPANPTGPSGSTGPSDSSDGSDPESAVDEERFDGLPDPDDDDAWQQI